MSRVHYQDEIIREAMIELDELEQSIGWNMQCAYPGNYREGEDHHQGAMSALAQIMEHFPKLRSLLDQIETRVLKDFLEAQQVEKKREADLAGEAEAKGFASVDAMVKHEWEHAEDDMRPF